MLIMLTTVAVVLLVTDGVLLFVVWNCLKHPPTPDDEDPD